MALSKGRDIWVTMKWSGFCTCIVISDLGLFGMNTIRIALMVGQGESIFLGLPQDDTSRYFAVLISQLLYVII